MSRPDLSTYPLPELIAHARVHCPFYRDLYRDLGDNPPLSALPVVDSDAYWAAHTRDPRLILAGDLLPNLVVNSGGTTGTPKHSYFGAAEWIAVAALSARAFAHTGLRRGDRIANIFSAGDLHSSFLLSAESLRIACPEGLQVPLGATMPAEEVIKALRVFKVNVLCGFPTQMLRLIEGLDPARDGVRLERLIFAGENFSREQRLYLENKYPGITVRSVGYASVDAGLIAFADETCAPGEHRPFDGATLVELLDDDTGQPIEEPGRAGRVVFTNLTRRVMPIIRYPVGDMGEWQEPAGASARRFTLLGRTPQVARIANCDLTVGEVSVALAPFAGRIGLTGFQLLVTQENLLDRLTVRIAAAAPPAVLAAAGPHLLPRLAEASPELAGLVAQGIVHPIVMEWTSRQDLVVHPRTGKLLPVVDRRKV